MNGMPSLEERLQESAGAIHYPATPDVARAVRLRLAVPRPKGNRLLRAALVTLIVLIAAALAVPSVRAQVIEFLRIGVVRIFPAPVTPTPASQPPLTATAGASSPTPKPTHIVYAGQPQPEHSISMQGLEGETTLEQARERFSYPILLPQEPADLGEPDRVFLQEDDQLLILVWLDPAEPGRARLSLHEIAPDSVRIEKYQPRVLDYTRVNGHTAAWVVGPYLVVLSSGDLTWRRIVDGNTLVWEADGITYRLESNLSLGQAVQIAESLQ